MRTLTVLFVLVWLASAAGDAQVTIRPGLYELTLEMNMGEAGKAVRDAAGYNKGKRLDCITADDVKQMLRGEQEDCATSNLKTSGNKVTFTLTCGTGDDRVLSDNEITVVGDTITTVAVSRFDGKVSSLKGTAKRVGECPK